MACEAMWQGRPISLEEFRTGGGVLAAVCGRPDCGAITPLTNSLYLALHAGASVARLEDGVRCTCGKRGGLLAMLRAEPTSQSAHRCFMFHG